MEKLLEKEFEIDFNILLRALKEGFKYKIKRSKIGRDNEYVEQIICVDYAYLYFANDLGPDGAWCLATIDKFFYLNDYGRLWVLLDEDFKGDD